MSNFGQVRWIPLIRYPFHRGPLISPAAKERVVGLISSVEEQGGRIILDGRRVDIPGYPDGNFVAPTIVEVTVDMKAYQ